MPQKQPLRGTRVLIAEDNAIQAYDLKLSLEDAGAEVVGPARTVAEVLANGKVVAHATSLAKALRLADMANLTLAILDFRLWRDDSLQVAKKLYTAQVPFIFHTGNATPLSEMWPLVPIVAKPAPPGRLISALVSLTTKAPRYVAA